MLHSYTFNDKTYSVISHEDGSVTEYQRGPRRLYYGDGDRQTWASLDEWVATWPANASPEPPTPVSQHPLIKKLFPHTPSTLLFGVSKEYANDLYADYNAASASHEDIAIWEVLECRSLIEKYEKYLDGEDTFEPNIIRPTNTYLLHDGQVLGVYHSVEDNIVLILDSPTVVMYITTDSKFLRRNEITGEMESV